jgi:lipopolysaccharide transport system permease protein
LIKREVVGRYRGSVMGLMWSFFNPVLMLAVYTFVFSVVFKARWMGGSDSKTEFALVLFAGLMVFNLFAECVNRAPSLILGNVNYVKKVIFPLELLPVIAFGSAAFHFLVSLLVWLIFFSIFFGTPASTIFWLPLVLIPLVLSTLGLSWLLASLGVYLRDVAQMIGVLTTILMFLSPIFYPVGALPAEYHVFMNINPLTFVVEQARDVMIFGRPMNGLSWLVQLVFSSLFAWLGFAWFQKTRKGFADVL